MLPAAAQYQFSIDVYKRQALARETLAAGATPVL